jgi:8-oxo-dGTP diphosphatase
MWDGPDFSGAKIALLSEGSLIAYKRDKKPDIPFPGMWDLPGGGREGNETPVACAIRETREEFGLVIDVRSIIWTRHYPGRAPRSPVGYFLVANVDRDSFRSVEFGDEGEQWAIMSVDDFLRHPEVIWSSEAPASGLLDGAGLLKGLGDRRGRPIVKIDPDPTIRTAGSLENQSSH